MDSVRAVETIDIFNRDQFQSCLSLVLCSRAEEQPIFDYAFKEFFFKTKEIRSNEDMLQFLSEEGKNGHRANGHTEREDKDIIENNRKKDSADKPGTSGIQGVQQKKNGSSGSSETGTGLFWVASRMGNKGSDEFQTHVPNDELGDMEKAARLMVRKIQLKRSYSFQTARKGIRPDFRKTIRRSLQTGGYPIHLFWKKRKRASAKFVLLCDASRSMSLYAHRFLQFAYALSKYTNSVEVFLFSTKIKRVTDQLFDRRAEIPVLNQLGDSWGGGTCIGESVFSFVQDYGPQMLHKDTVFIIASDGLDAGDISRMAWSMKEIQRRTSAVLWLNPLLQIKGYEPTARGMKAALPYIDVFAEASDAQSFTRLAKKIQIRR